MPWPSLLLRLCFTDTSNINLQNVDQTTQLGTYECDVYNNVVEYENQFITVTLNKSLRQDSKTLISVLGES